MSCRKVKRMTLKCGSKEDGKDKILDRLEKKLEGNEREKEIKRKCISGRKQCTPVFDA